MPVPYYGDFPVNHTGVIIPFNTLSSDDPSASVTITNLVSTDVHIHKNGEVAQRTSASGVTVSIDFDGITGNHQVKIDLSDNTDAGFYVASSEVTVRIEGTTIDGATINAWIGTFSIERAGGTVALLKLIQAAVITNAAGVDVAADIIAIKAETALIVADTDELQTDDYPTSIAAVKAETALIVADTDELQTDDYPTSIAAIKAETALIVADTDELQTDDIPAAIAALPDAAAINAEVVDALNVDTYAEPGQEAPGATVSLAKKISYGYKLLINMITNDGTTIKVYNNAGDTVDQKSTVSEAAGTVTRGKFGTGP